MARSMPFARGRTRAGGDHKQPGHELKRGDMDIEAPISKPPYPHPPTNQQGAPSGTKASSKGTRP